MTIIIVSTRPSEMVAKKQSHEKNFGFWQNIKTVVVSHKKKIKEVIIVKRVRVRVKLIA